MGNLKPIDSALVKDVDYDLISPDTVGGEYIETIGAACENPDGYTSGSLFLGRENGVQHLYRVTAAIAFGETIILDTNCVYTTVSGELQGKAEESEVSSLNEALTNIDSVISANGAKNLAGPFVGISEVRNGLTISVNTDSSSDDYGTITISGTASARTDISVVDANTFFLGTGRYKVSGCPSGGSTSTYYVTGRVNGEWATFFDDGDGAIVNASTSITGLIVRVMSGFAFTTPLIFKPMITLADQPNSDYAHYVPYAKTNRELTKDIKTRLVGTNGSFNEGIEISNKNYCAELIMESISPSDANPSVILSVNFSVNKLVIYRKNTLNGNYVKYGEIPITVS